jgi:vitamin B12 transporter
MQGIWTPTEDIDVSATLRFDDNNRYGDFTSGRLAASWRPTNSITLRGAFARGFRAPSLYEQFGDTRFGILPNPNLTPEQSESAEIGIDYEWSGGASLSATAFWLDADNEIGFDANYINVFGTSKRKGVELETHIPVGGIAEIGIAYTYTDALQPSGVRISRVPRHLLNVSLDGNITERVTGSLAMRHVAGFRDGFPARDMPDFTVVDAQFGYELSDATELTLRADNLFDEEYQEIDGYGTSGRALYVGIRAKF